MTNLFNGLSFQTLFDAAVDVMLLIDSKGHIINANSAAQAFLGYADNKICGLEVEALMPESCRAHYRHILNTFYSKPAKHSMRIDRVLKILHHDGSELTVDIGLSLLKAEEQFYILMTLYAADRRNKAEEALRVSEERLRLAKQAAGLGVFDFDSNKNVLHWDERMRELWGAESHEAITTKRFLTAIHPKDRKTREAALNRAIDPAGNGEYRTEYRVIDPTNNHIRWVSVVGRMHFEEGNASRLLGVAIDITEQKNLEKKLQDHRAETEALFAQQVAAQTASAIAHELNQPLAAISAYSEVALHALKSNEIDSDNMKRALEGCVQQAQRAGNSLHELMAFLQKGDLLKDPLDMNDVVKEALNIAKSYGYGEFHPMLQLEQNMPHVQGNRTQVLKILINLLRNAVEAMRGMGVTTSAITIQVQTNTDINMAHVTIQDSGPGLDAETAKRVFEPFFTTKPSGMGMGLAISRALTEANGGQLWLDPNTKAGATFHFTLPFAS